MEGAMAQINNKWQQSPHTNFEDGAGVFLVIGLAVLAGFLLWSFATSLLVPALSLAGTLAGAVLQGPLNGRLADLVVDLVWGVGVGLFVGWVRWQRRKASGAVETVVEAVVSPDVVSSASLGWMYILLHIGAGLVASVAVWLLGVAFPLQILGGGTDATRAGLEYLRVGGWIAGGGGGLGGDGGEPGLLLFLLLFLFLVALPLLSGLISVFTAVCLKDAASGAVGAAGKGAGLVFFLVLTRIRGRFYLPRPPTPKPPPAPPAPPPVAGPLVIDQIVEDFVATEPLQREGAVKKYFSWLKQEGIEPDARTIGENAPRYKDPVIYDLARRVNFEAARRDLHRVACRLEAWKRDTEEAWKRDTEEARSHHEQRLREELFGPGWLKRAALQGLGAGALTGLLTGLLVAGALAMLRGH